MQYDFDIAVIGAGTAGLVSAFVADSLGARVALIEADKVGGECLWRGCVPSKTLIRSARAWEQTKRCEEFGVHVEKPKLVWSAIRLRLADVRDDIRRLEREQLSSTKIEQVNGRARFVDAHTLEISGPDARSLTANKFILATGSEPVVPDIAGLREVGCIPPHGLFERPNLPRSLVFLGGGPNSCEMAQTFARFGTKVSIVHSGNRLLPREEPEISAELLKFLRADGVDVHLNARAMRVEMSGAQKAVFWNSSEGEQSVKAGEIVLGTGKKPDVSSLNLQAANVFVDESGGVKVDEKLGTSAAHIWACGDVLGRDYFTHVAEHEGKIAGANAVLPAPLRRRIDYKGLPWVTFCDPEIAHVGLTTEQARERGERPKVYDVPFNTLDRAIIEGETGGFARLITTPSGRLLGAHIIGPSAGEIAGALILPVRDGALLHELADAMFPYPTLAEILHRAGNEIYREMLDSKAAQTALKLLLR
jgi:pyruvate/2-oxoglutarate dehydrogenase complex dihydrolipoamide dehydrogenase (E3) component